MGYARLIDGAWSEPDAPFTVGEGDAAIKYPAAWLDGADDIQRAALGAVAIVVEPDPVGVPLAGYELVDVAGVPHRRPVPLPLAAARSQRLAALAAIRWDRQQAVAWNGRQAPADDTTMGRIVAAMMRAQLSGGAGFPIRWKFAADDFADLSADDLKGYGMAIGQHMQACFDNEASLAEQLGAAADIAALAAIDLTAGWPT